MQKSLSYVIDLTQIALFLFLAVVGMYWAEQQKLAIDPVSFPKSQPVNPNKDKKPLLPRLRGEEEHDLIGKISLGGAKSPDGKPVMVDFPISEDIRNIGSHKDGYGMCVMSSIEMASRWASLDPMRGLRDWCAQEAGGGYPKKVDDQLKRFAKAHHTTVPDYIQYQGDDIEFLRLALKTRRMIGVTYAGRDGVRYKGPIAHMLCLVHLQDGYVALYDNNGTPGKLLWMTEREFSDRWLGGGNGWAFVWLAPPPPPAKRSL